ncbi:ribosome production factor 2 homolog [Copidosoma floridanum]|uniref:ribosome production factor 2 homolog n=1 Tax=Copidosoma floridanum TaxID=29053 RepID=UPI0006C9803E|nr:ribosome production factor 2 homolog [Copidosoma floridanum]XP_014212479.1 ribosome production factor 2 homolog [Copidosoma floridanum]
MGVIERVVKPKTHRAKRALEKKEPKIIEDPKQTIYIKGSKTSPIGQSCMKDLYQLKKPGGQMMQKRNEIHPFEDATLIEKFSKKYNAALFMFVSSNKKRPHNLVLGRLFEHTLMDMVEFGVENYTALETFKTEKICEGIKPILVFQGELFENNHEYGRIRNLLVDMFQRETVGQIRLQGLEHVLSFTAHDNCILFRSYRVQLKKSGTRIPKIELVEIGPRMDLRVRRTKLATDDLFKQACKRPKELKVKKKKNISEDGLGKTLGRIHMGSQKLHKIQTRKMKGLRKTPTEVKAEKKRKSLIVDEESAKKLKVVNAEAE